jgi:hypothetical protein
LSYSHVAMDVNGDGRLDHTAWAGAQDGVLVWDKHGDGVVRDASQYAFTQYGGQTDLQGLAAGFDSNHDGVFNAQDAKFAEFAVWQDANQNGVSDAGEVRSLADRGIESINLTSDGVQRSPATGVTEAGQTTAMLGNGSSMLVADALFAYTTVDYAVAGDTMNVLGSNITLDLSSILSTHQNVQAIDLTGTAVNGVTGANTVQLLLADVLSVAPTDGVHQLTLTGDANDKVMLVESEWIDTGTVVNQFGHTYAVYTGTGDTSAQLLMDQAVLKAGSVI